MHKTIEEIKTMDLFSKESWCLFRKLLYGTFETWVICVMGDQSIRFLYDVKRWISSSCITWKKSWISVVEKITKKIYQVGNMIDTPRQSCKPKVRVQNKHFRKIHSINISNFVNKIMRYWLEIIGFRKGKGTINAVSLSFIYVNKPYLSSG